MTNDNVGDAGDVIIGAEAIARATGLAQRRVFHLASRGELPGAFKLSGRLALSQAAYRVGLADRIAAASRKVAA